MATSALVFSISPSRKKARKNEKDEEKYMLILASFNKASASTWVKTNIVTIKDS